VRRAIVLAALVIAAGSCGDGDPAFEPRELGEVKVPARVAGPSIEAAAPSGFVKLFWAGVNLGSTIPGYQPGEVAATREDYDRWLDGMGDLGVRVVRICTILRPAFYDALADYNDDHQDRPIFFMQGVWVPDEEILTSTGDAYDQTMTDGFRAEIEDAVAVVHGDSELPERPGHASGRFRSDVSRWLLAFSIGIEWDPYAVRSTDRKNAGAQPFQGRYIRASQHATPLESWIASMLDHTAALDAERGWSRPLAFTNWLTLDPPTIPRSRSSRRTSCRSTPPTCRRPRRGRQGSSPATTRIRTTRSSCDSPRTTGPTSARAMARKTRTPVI
jgi:hypothetical protein